MVKHTNFNLNSPYRLSYMEVNSAKYLNECDVNVIFDMNIVLLNMSHDEITQFTTKFHSCRATSNNYTVQKAFLFFF